MEFVHTLTDTQFEQLFEMYSQLWWTSDRNKEQLKLALNNSTLLVGIVEKNQLIAFARVLSDKAFKAVILDVVVHPNYHGKGIGSEIMQHIIHHPELKNVTDFELYCKEELNAYYQKFGFEKLVKPINFLRFSR